MTNHLKTFYNVILFWWFFLNLFAIEDKKNCQIFPYNKRFWKKRDKKKNAGMQSLKLKFAVVEGFDKENLSKICEKIFPWNSADVLAVFARVSEALIST